LGGWYLYIKVYLTFLKKWLWNFLTTIITYGVWSMLEILV